MNLLKMTHCVFVKTKNEEAYIIGLFPSSDYADLFAVACDKEDNTNMKNKYIAKELGQ